MILIRFGFNGIYSDLFYKFLANTTNVDKTLKS